jgi:predicted RNase H-like HicB family nuclease
MRDEFTALIERDGEWFISCCSDVPGANGQGESREACLESLRQAIRLVLEDQREDVPA